MKPHSVLFFLYARPAIFKFFRSAVEIVDKNKTIIKGNCNSYSKRVNMLLRDKILKETSPLSIFFVKSGSGGNRLLFRYPFDEKFLNESDFDFGFYNSKSTNQTSINTDSTIIEQDLLQFRNIISENDEALCNMFSVNPNLCGQKFEIKINSVRHVGHPMSLLPPPTFGFQSCTSQLSCNTQQTATTNNIRSKYRSGHHSQPSHGISSSYDFLNSQTKSTTSTNTNNTIQGDITSFNIVCALSASASYDIVDCYHDLSKRLAIALSFEERRCSYLSKEIKTILATLDECDMANLANQADQLHPLDKNKSSNNISGGQNTKNINNSLSGHDNITQNGHVSSDQNDSVFNLILSRSNLAKDLKRVFISLSTSGIVDLKINNWVSVSFCLPQKVHRLKLMTHKSMPAIGTKDIKRCLLYLRPYHGLLLLYEPQELLDSLPIDASPAFIQLIRVTKPDKNFMDLSVDANLTLMQIFCIVSQLIYWSKATVIYPICDSNIYAIHPLASTGIQSKVAHDFRTRFPNSKSLHHYLADFSEGTSLTQLNGPLLNIEEKLNLLSIVTWLLQSRILTQVHKYIFLVVDKESDHNHNKTSLSESFESSLRRYRTDSLPESQEDSNFGLNSSLSSTPNSNLEYPSPSNDANNRYSLSSSCPLDNPLGPPGMTNGSIITTLQKAGLTLSGAKHVLAIPSSKNPEDLKLLIRLLPYFDGKHHVEDIMFFENLERSQVLILCDKYRDILFTCHYEDVAVSQLSPYNNTR